MQAWEYTWIGLGFVLGFVWIALGLICLKKFKSKTLETKEFYHKALTKEPTKFQCFKLKAKQLLLSYFRFLYRNRRIVKLNRFHKDFWSKHKAIMPRKVSCREHDSID